jgi:hypothetical protein
MLPCQPLAKRGGVTRKQTLAPRRIKDEQDMEAYLTHVKYVHGLTVFSKDYFVFKNISRLAKAKYPSHRPHLVHVCAVVLPLRA